MFDAGLDDVTTITSILRSRADLEHTDDASVMAISKDGIRVITGWDKTFQVSVYFAAILFQRFTFNCDNLVYFRFSLKDFIECLNLFGDDNKTTGDEENRNDIHMRISLTLQFMRYGEPLRMRLENRSNYVINCALTGYNAPQDSKFCPLALLDGEETAVIILNSRKFYDYVSGLDLTSSDFVNLTMGRGDTPLQLSTKSTLLGEVELEITSNEKDIIVKDIVVSDNCLFSFSYKTQFMKPALEGLRTSELVQIKCGSGGLLCIEHFHEASSDRNPRDEQRMAGGTGNHTLDLLNESIHDQSKRSSVEYFILSEAKPEDACPEYNIY